MKLSNHDDIVFIGFDISIPAPTEQAFYNTSHSPDSNTVFDHCGYVAPSFFNDIVLEPTILVLDAEFEFEQEFSFVEFQTKCSSRLTTAELSQLYRAWLDNDDETFAFFKLRFK